MSATEGGYAFPTTDEQSDNGITAAPGMTLRDYFAAKAMQAWLPIWVHNPDFDLCKRAYSTADNMLKARTT